MKNSIHYIFLFLFTFTLNAQTYKDRFTSEINLNSNVESSNFEITIVSPNGLASSYTITLPSEDGNDGEVLISDGNGSLTWTTLTSVANAVGNDKEVQFNESGNFASSASFVYDYSNDYLGVNQSNPTYTLDVNNVIRSGNSSVSGELIIYSEQGATDYQISFVPSNSTTISTNYTWPGADGEIGRGLNTDGSGVLRWSATFRIGPTGTGNSNNDANSDDSYVGGGTANDINNNADNAFVGSGNNNDISNNAENSSIGGGASNDINNNAEQSIVIGGGQNDVNNNSVSSGIFGGSNNDFNNNTSYGFVGGGNNNDIGNNNDDSGIVAGTRHNFTNNGDRSIIFGGDNNDARSDDMGIFVGQNIDNNGDDRHRGAIFAGRAHDINDGTDYFIGAGNGTDIQGDYSACLSGDGNAVNDPDSYCLYGLNVDFNGGQYNIMGGRTADAAGVRNIAFGRRVKANDDGCFMIADASNANCDSDGNNSMTARFTGGFYFYTNTALTTGQSFTGGSNWASVSDSNMKEKVLKLNPIYIANKLRNLKISSWSYKGYGDQGIRNYGPMAQDFYRLFGKDKFGTFASETRISTHDLASILIAGVKGSDQLNNDQKSEVKEEKVRLNNLETKLQNIEERIKRLEEGINKY